MLTLAVGVVRAVVVVVAFWQVVLGLTVLGLLALGVVATAVFMAGASGVEGTSEVA